MLTALTLLALATLGGGGAATPTQDEATPAALQAVLEQARRDFDARHAELGLLGAAPLPGTEQASGPAAEAMRSHAAPGGPATSADEHRAILDSGAEHKTPQASK